MRQNSRWPWRVLVAALIVAITAGLALALNASQSSARQGVADRFAARSGLAAKFVSTYAKQLAEHEQQIAGATLAGEDVLGSFDSDVSAFGFQAAVLLDDTGRALAVAPAAPKLIGQQIGSRYAHLSAALRGQVAVSNVVLSAAERTPVIAFAVPYQSPYGRRVFSGAYRVSDTPIKAFLDNITTVKGAQLFIVDSTNTVVAANGPRASDIHTLAQADPALARVAASAARGTYRVDSHSYYFARAAIASTPWTLVIAAPTGGLFIAVEGANHWGPWLILAALTLVAGLAGWLGIRQFEARRRLTELNHSLDQLARTDSLTGLANRRALNEVLEKLLPNAQRHELPLSVLMIDIDHFKRLNDSYGHHAGDEAIRHIAQLLAGTLRAGDFLARWGGEEFLVVLPHADLAEAFDVAERLRRTIATGSMHVGYQRHLISVQASVGVAQANQGDVVETLVDRADQGLYEAKTSGRNTVRAMTDMASKPARAGEATFHGSAAISRTGG